MLAAATVPGVQTTALVLAYLVAAGIVTALYLKLQPGAREKPAAS